jgi:hypothetical protein
MKVQLSSFKVIEVCTIIGWFHFNVTNNVLSYFNRVNWGPATSNFTLNIWHASTDFLYHTVETIAVIVQDYIQLFSTKCLYSVPTSEGGHEWFFLYASLHFKIHCHSKIESRAFTLLR